MYKIALDAVAWFLKNLPLLGITVLMIITVGFFNHNQQEILKWQKTHGQHSKLVHDLILATDKRLDKSDQAMDNVQNALYKVTLVINALQASAERIDKVRDHEVQRLLSRAKLLQKKLRLNVTASKVYRKAMRRQLLAYKKKLKRLEDIQRAKDIKRRPLDL